MRLVGDVALVTGAGKGTGAAIARRLASEGAKVVVTARQVEAAERIAAEIQSYGGQAYGMALDVSDERQVQKVIDAAVDRFGGLTVLVNNAALVDGVQPGIDRPLAEQTNSGFGDIMDVNLWGVFWCCKYTIGHMVRGGGGSIVNISSSSSVRATPGLPTYAASKAATNSLTRSIAVDYGAAGIRCNTLVLGLIRAHYMEESLQVESTRRAFAQHAPLGRVGSPSDVADAVLFLASAESAFISGVMLPLDGGASARSSASAGVLASISLGVER